MYVDITNTYLYCYDLVSSLVSSSCWSQTRFFTVNQLISYWTDLNKITNGNSWEKWVCIGYINTSCTFCMLCSENYCVLLLMCWSIVQGQVSTFRLGEKQINAANFFSLFYSPLSIIDKGIKKLSPVITSKTHSSQTIKISPYTTYCIPMRNIFFKRTIPTFWDTHIYP